MEIAFDLHIHSALSPCSNDDMTPNNIVNMAILKGLDIISVTDHNTASNLPAVSYTAVENGIMLLPGIEVQTKEEIHMLCYFRNLKNALIFGDIIYSKLPNIKADDEAFGRQLIMDSSDNITGYLDKLLLSSADISVSSLFRLTQEYGGICIPAHIDRPSFSIISNLGFLPGDLSIQTVEISKDAAEKTIRSKLNFSKDIRIIKSSDAHNLWDISERENFINLDVLTLSGLFNLLNGRQT